MRYRELKVEFEANKERLYRILYVREDLDLYTLGVAILVSLGATFEHAFYFEDRNRHFDPEIFEDLFNDDEYMTDYHLKDLKLDSDGTFKLIYDSGDYWCFVVTVSDKPTIIQSRKYAILKDAKGQGIWEDRITSLYNYLEGKISKTAQEDESEGLYLPWNFNNKTFGDFDKKINIDKVNKKLNDEIYFALKELEKNGCF